MTSANKTNNIYNRIIVTGPGSDRFQDQETSISALAEMKDTWEEGTLYFIFLDVEHSRGKAQKIMGGAKSLGEESDRLTKDINDITTKCSGKIASYMGDAYTLVFRLPSDAIKAAIDIAKMSTTRFHIAVGSGQIAFRDDCIKLSGEPLNRLGRVQALSEHSHILCFEEVARTSCDEPIDATFSIYSHGRYEIEDDRPGNNQWEVWEICPETVTPFAKAKGKEIVAIGCHLQKGRRPKAGDVIENKYTLDGLLGKGGFGEVWKAVDSNKQEYAIKFCYHKEAGGILKKQHELQAGPRAPQNAVKSLEQGEWNQLHYLALEYFEGESLDKVITRMKENISNDEMTLSECRALLLRVADALIPKEGCEYLPHGDLKPHNILVRRQPDSHSWKMKITDYGSGPISCLQDSGQSTESQLVGTVLSLSYLAPEIKNTLKPTEKGDVYALGMILYQWCIRDAERELSNDARGDIIAQGYHPVLADICANATAHDLEKRFSMEDFLNALRDYDKSVCKRRWKSVGIVGVGIAFVIVIGYFVYLQWQEAELQRQETNAQRQEAQGQRQVAELQKAEARRRLYSSSMLQARTQQENGRYDLARDALWQAPVEYSNWDWGYTASQLYPELIVLRGHKVAVNSATFSPDSTRIITASDDNTVRIWNAATGEELKVLRGHEGRKYRSNISSAAFSPESKRVITVAPDGTTYILDAATGEERIILETQELRYSINSAAFSYDGMRVVTAGSDGMARIFDAVTAKEITVLQVDKGNINSVIFSPDGMRVATANDDGTARIFDVAMGEELFILRGHEGSIFSVTFSPDGIHMVTAGVDGTARVWNATTAEELFVLRGHNPIPYGMGLCSAAFSPDGTRLITAVRDSTARIWNVATGEELNVLRGHKSQVVSAAFSPDGTRVLTADVDGVVYIWDVAACGNFEILHENVEGVDFAVFSPEGGRMVRVTAYGKVSTWDLASGEELILLPGYEFIPHQMGSCSAAFSPDGMRVVTAAFDSTAQIWDTATGKELTILRGHENKIHSVAFNPDGTRVVTATDDRTARIWDVATGEELAVLQGHELPVWDATFSPDGKCVVTLSEDGTACIWDIITGKGLVVLRGHDSVPYSLGSYSAVFSPDSMHVVTVSRERVARIWDVTTGKELLLLQGHENSINSTEFSQDGERLITASFDGTVCIWNADTGKLLSTLRGHEILFPGRFSCSAAFSPDGKRVVTAGLDSTARIWDTEGGVEIVVLRDDESRVISAVFSSDGMRLVTVSHKKTVEWEAAPWRLEDLPEVAGSFESPEEERKARFFEWKRQQYQRWLKTHGISTQGKISEQVSRVEGETP